MTGIGQLYRVTWIALLPALSSLSFIDMVVDSLHALLATILDSVVPLPHYKVCPANLHPWSPPASTSATPAFGLLRQFLPEVITRLTSSLTN